MAIGTEKCLSRQLLDELTDFLPDDGPVIVVRDADGQLEGSDPDRIDLADWQECLEHLHEQTCDGWEPAVTQRDHYSVAALQVGTEPHDVTTVFLILEGYSQETALANMGLIETLLGQIYVIAGLLMRAHQLERFLRFPKRSRTAQRPLAAG